MKVKVTYYLDVISSWCYWAEPAWTELKKRYAKSPVEFSWKIALQDESRISKSRAQYDWFHRCGGAVARAAGPCGWVTEATDYLAPNCVAEAARDLGMHDDRVRIAMMEAVMRHGKRVGEWEVAATVGATASGLTKTALLKGAQSVAIKNRVQATTSEFHSLDVIQRPAFLLEDDIGDRAVFSGLVKVAPLAAAIDAMLEDSAHYASYAAHHGP